MNGNPAGMSPARVFFGFAVLVAACAFFANAIDFDVFDANAFLFVVAGSLACCVMACSMETMRSGVMCFNGPANCDPVQASGFWNSFGTYAWWSGIVGAGMCTVAYAGAIKGPSSFDVVLVPSMYCLAYGMFLKMVGMSVACAVCGSCVPGGVCAPMGTMNAAATAPANAAKKNPEEKVGV